MRRIAIVTGASSGLGREFSRQLCKEKFSLEFDELWLFARRRPLLEQLAAELSQSQKRVKVFAEDICGRNGVRKFGEILASEGNSEFEIRILVNNAGFGTYGVFERSPLERELDMIDLNALTLTGFCHLALPRMGRGSLIINTASLAGFWPLGNFAVYAASKAYALNFSIALAAELRDRGIHALALCPGPVDTEFAEVASSGARKNVRHGKDAAKVVAHCLKSARRKKFAAVMSFGWKVQALASRLFSRYAGARATYKFCKRPNADIDGK